MKFSQKFDEIRFQLEGLLYVHIIGAGICLYYTISNSWEGVVVILFLYHAITSQGNTFSGVHFFRMKASREESQTNNFFVA